jgi:hypothetical protein
MRDTIDMAREAGLSPIKQSCFIAVTNDLKRFEALVRADEREACAKVCDDMGPCGFTGESCAEAIRARGNT